MAANRRMRICRKLRRPIFFICRNHPFIDGNKRAALGACLVFLRLNEIEPEMTVLSGSNSHLMSLERLDRDEHGAVAEASQAGKTARKQIRTRVFSFAGAGCSLAAHFPDLNSRSDATNAVFWPAFWAGRVDAFDFFVLVFVLSKAATEFICDGFGQDDAGHYGHAGLSSWAGALLFRLAGDRYGRRVPLMWKSGLLQRDGSIPPGWRRRSRASLVCRWPFGGWAWAWGMGPRRPARPWSTWAPALARRSSPAFFCNKVIPFGYLWAACCFRLIPAGMELAFAFPHRRIAHGAGHWPSFLRPPCQESAVWQKTGTK